MYAYFRINPKVNISYTNQNDEWAQSATVTIKFDSENSNKYEYYFKSSRNATSSSAVYNCGTGTNPGTCSSTTTTAIVANTWYKATNDSTIVYNTTLTSTGTLYTRNYEGALYSETVTNGILKIDVTPPIPTLSYTNASYNSGYLTSGTANITCSDSNSGYKSGNTSKAFSNSGSISTTCVDNVGNTTSINYDVTIYGYGQSSQCSWNNCLTGSNTCSSGYDCPSGYSGGGSSSTCTMTTQGTYDSCLTGSNTCSPGCPTGWTIDGNKCKSSTSTVECNFDTTCIDEYKSGCGAASNKTECRCDGSTPGPSVKCYFRSLKDINSCATGSNTCQGGYKCPSGYSGGGSSSTCSKTTEGTLNSCKYGSNTCQGGYDSCWHTI